MQNRPSFHYSVKTGVSRRELLVSRICSGSVRIKLDDGRVFLVKRPSREARYVANEVFQEALEEAELGGLYSEDGLLAYLLEHDFWDEEREELFEKLPKDIEELKVGLFQATFRSNERKTIRAALDAAKQKYAELLEQRGRDTHLSCLGFATLARARYILGASLWDGAGPVFTSNEQFWHADCELLDEVMEGYSRLRLSEPDFRDLARNEPWRSIWSCHKLEGTLFGVAPVDYTEEQLALANWSNLYDSIYQHPECPPDDVIADDDMLDGWMIVQKRKRASATPFSDPHPNADEVYIVADTMEDAKKIHELNSAAGKATVKRRFDHLRKHRDREVNELDMPDTRQRLRMEVTQRAKR